MGSLSMIMRHPSERKKGAPVLPYGIHSRAFGFHRSTINWPSATCQATTSQSSDPPPDPPNRFESAALLCLTSGTLRYLRRFSTRLRLDVRKSGDTSLSLRLSFLGTLTSR